MTEHRPVEPDGLQLEVQRAAHAVEMYPLLRDPVLWEFIDRGPPTDEKALQDRFQRLEHRSSPDGKEAWLNWIVRRADGVAVGYVEATVHCDQPAEPAEIAFVLGRNYWGRGYAFAATRLMIAELIARHGVTRMVASVDPRNVRSINLMRRLGFSPREKRSESGDLIFEAAVPPSESREPD